MVSATWQLFGIERLRDKTMHKCYTLVSKKRENYRTSTLVFDQPLPAYPGQFVMVWLPRIGEKPYCVTNGAPLTLTVVSVGKFSEALYTLQPGSKVWVRGPFGHGYQIKGEYLLLVGGGYGVASLLFLAKQAISIGCQQRICIGASSKRDILLQDEFASLGIPVHITTEDGSSGTSGLVTALVSEMLDDFKPDWIYACGPTSMLIAISHRCRERNLSHQLSWEAHIRCGLGLCGSCEGVELQPWVPEGWLVCQDGPVQVVDLSEA
jgi:dihydroorotate dehydrogenase electron transfer subunit